MFILSEITSSIDASALNSVASNLMNKGIALGGKIIVSFLVYFIGSWIISLLRKLLKNMLHRKGIDPEVQSFLNSTANILLKAVLLIAIVGILGIETASLAAIMAALAFAVGMAMKDNLSNFASGVLILIAKPFRLNQRIVVQGLDGIVTSISFVYTVLRTGDGKTIYIPNGTLMSSNVINYSDPENLRVDLSFNISYGNSTKEIKEMFTEIVTANNKILLDPAPFIGVTNVKDGNFEVTVRAWAKNSDYGDVAVELNEAIYGLLEDKNIYTPSVVNVKMVNPNT